MRLPHILAPLGLALALSGCSLGEDRLSKAQYEEHVRTTYAHVQEAFAATDVPGGQLASRLADAQTALRDAAEALEEVEPPKEVEKENEEIVEGMREYAENLDAVRAAAANRDQSAIDDFNARIRDNEAVERIAEAAEEMKFKGYDLGPIAEE